MTVLNRSLRLRAFLAVVVCTVLVVVVGVSALPQDRYVRFQSLRGTLHARAEWVYDRIHHDPTPIDILVVGPSRSAVGIDGGLLERLIDQQTGTDLKVANLSFAEPGPNLPYLMLREALETKQPKLVIVGILEQQARNGHPAFKDLADPWDIVSAPIVVNWDYFRNLMFLPMRQLRLATDTLLAPLLGFRRQFDPAQYGGASLDLNAAYPIHQRPPSTVAELGRDIVAYRRTLTHPFLPASMGGVEFAAQRDYFEKMRALVSEHHAQLVFVYFRPYEGLQIPQDLSFYEKLGPVLIPPQSITDDPNNFYDIGHLNAEGRRALTTWLAGALDRDAMTWRTSQSAADPGVK